MGCLDANVIQQFIAGSLAPGPRESVEEHLRGCETCSYLVAALSPEDVRSATEQASPRSKARISTVRPRMVERYEIAEPLGEGGMGIVYAAYDPELHREVALKLLRSTAAAAGDTAGARARLLREAQAMARIAHPNVIAVYDVGVWENQVFVAMELAPKGTLRKWQSVPGRGWREIVDAYLAAGRGLVAAHAAGLVHRDFKPDNVLVGADGRMRVTDFGLARTDNAPPESDAAASGMLEVSLTMTGAVMGTPAYMAPEQIDRESTDARSDQFSFCVAMWEALYGRRPFAGATLADVREAIERHAVSAPKSDVALPIQRGLLRGLSARPEDRWPTMAALLEALAPRRSPRKGIAIGLAAAVLVGGTVSAIGTWLGRKHVVGCEPPAVPASLWPARRITIAARIPPDVVRRVDGWFDAWNAAAASTCERDDTNLRTRRARCLVGLLDDVDVQLSHWEHGQQVVPLDAHTAFEELPRVTRCSAAAQRAVIDPSPGKLAPLRMLETAFAPVHGNASALRTLLAQARALDSVPLQVAIMIELAGVEYATDQKAAARTMREGIAVADREPAEVPRITARLRMLEILGANSPDETSALEDATRHLIVQLGGDAELLGALEYIVGKNRVARLHTDEALAAYQRAKGEFQIAYGPDSIHEMLAWIGISGAHATQSANGLAVREARDVAIAITQRIGVYVRFLRLMGELENTKALIAEGKDALAFSRTYEPPATVFQSEINLGTAYFLDGQWESALEHLQIGTDGSESIGARDDTIISASAIRARLLGEHGRTAEALPIARHAIEMAIAIRDDRAIGETERELGAVALASGDLVTARDALARSLAAYDKAHTPPDERARAKFLLAQATWPVDRAEAIDLAHAARSDLHGTSSPLTTRQEKQLDDMNRWLAAHH